MLYIPESEPKSPKRRNRMRHSRLIMTARAAAVAVVSLSAVSAPATASAFLEVAPRCTSAIPSSTRSTGASTRYMSLDQVSDFYQNFPIQSAVITCGFKASVADTIAQVTPQIEENKNKDKEARASALEASSVLPPTASIVSRLKHHKLKQNQIESINNNNNSIDWEARRNLAYVLYGGIFIGLMSHIEYSCVFPLVFGNEKTVAITIAKVFFDNLLVAPLVWLPPAYFIKAWVYGAPASASPTSETDGVLSIQTSAKRIFQEGLDKYLVDIKDNDLLWKYWTIWFPAQSISFSVVPDHLRVAFMASISFFWFILFSSVSSKEDNKTATTTTATATRK